LNPKEGGGGEVASNEHIRRVIEEIEKIRRQIRNSKLKVKRRIGKLEKTFDSLERQRIELEIELLKRKLLRWEIVETKLSISIMRGTLFEGRLEAQIDWSKAGKA
jgi:septal ring factor EnvC (AmiA/AmiB activator)